jgi:hypothetical protein
MAGLVLVTPPATEPVTLGEAKVFARIEHTAEDGLITNLITAARKRCEDWRGQSFVTQTWDFFLDFFPTWANGYVFDGFTPIGAQPGVGFPAANNWRAMPIILPRPPLQSVMFIKYTPFNAGPVTMDPATYQVDASNILAPRVVPNFDRMWPTDLLQSVNGVNVRFVAGYLPDVPEQISLAIKQLVAFWFVNRDATGTIPESVDALLSEVPGGFTYA